MATNRKLPLFVIPEELKYDHVTNKQILTIYNPFDVLLKYKILCTAPQRYRVTDSQGTLRSQCCVDVVIVHLEVDRKIEQDGQEEEEDKFCVNLYQGNNKLLGQKHVTSRISKRNITTKTEGNEFKELPSTINKSNNGQRSFSLHTTTGGGQSSPGWLTITLGLLSLLILLLPLDGESSSWPDWLHVTVNMKLIAAFVLGLVTMAILKL